MNNNCFQFSINVLHLIHKKLPSKSRASLNRYFACGIIWYVDCNEVLNRTVVRGGDLSRGRPARNGKSWALITCLMNPWLLWWPEKGNIFPLGIQMKLFSSSLLGLFLNFRDGRSIYCKKQKELHIQKIHRQQLWNRCSFLGNLSQSSLQCLKQDLLAFPKVVPIKRLRTSWNTLAHLSMLEAQALEDFSKLPPVHPLSWWWCLRWKLCWCKKFPCSFSPQELWQREKHLKRKIFRIKWQNGGDGGVHPYVIRRKGNFNCNDIMIIMATFVNPIIQDHSQRPNICWKSLVNQN